MFKRKATVLSIIFLTMVSGCVTSGRVAEGDHQHADNRIPERYALQQPVELREQPQEGSIFSAMDKDLYRDSRAREVGDIILVKIVETSSGDKKAETKTKRDSSITGGIAGLFGLENWVGNHNANFTPSNASLDAGLINNFTGSGETTRDSRITATISARVVEKTMDGNLIIRGYREIRLNDETQHIILSGVVRPQDISPDNSILSSYIADARIDYDGTGVIAEKQRPGWLARGLDVLWPF